MTPIFAVPAVLLAGLALNAAQTTPVAGHFERGIRAYERGDHSTAAAELAEFLKSAEEGSEKTILATAALGLSYYLQSDHHQALPLLQAASDVSRENIEVAYALARTNLRLGHPGAARLALARLFGLPPDSAAAHLVNVKFLVELNLWHSARAELESAEKKQNDLPQLHYYFGLLAMQSADWDVAVDRFTRETTINPTFHMAQYHLGRALAEQKNRPRAIEALQKAVWLNPYFSGPYLLLGKLYHQEGRLELARGVLEKALAMDVNNVIGHYLIGNVHRDLGNKEEAAKHYQISRELKLRESR